jgi:flagellar motor switch protein FliN/FliY
VSKPFKKPLSAAEIEALLRSSRDLDPVGRSDVVSSEPLGPGDVQHLRNMDLHEEPSAVPSWPYDAVSTEELLQQAEDHLASVLSPENVPLAETISEPVAAASIGPESQSVGVPLSVIGDLELDVTLELGRAELMIEDLLALREGSVVTLDKEAGEPIDILASGKLIARGEVIVVDDKFCVRICEVIR